MTRFTIGRAAQAANVNVETIRFYERQGLIVQPPKPPGSGAREYDWETVERIRFVRQAQDIGFSLREIGEFLSLRTDPNADCAEVRTRAVEKRAEVQTKLKRLSRIRDALDDLIACCPGGGGVTVCTILEAIERGGGGATTSNALPTDPADEGKSDMKTMTLTIDGMHCEGCARTVEALLGSVVGVHKAEASFGERQARVLHDPGSASEQDLKAAIAKGGFKAKVQRP